LGFGSTWPFCSAIAALFRCVYIRRQDVMLGDDLDKIEIILGCRFRSG
jgi:hypothetical protein